MTVIDIQSTRASKNKPAEAGRERYEKETAEKPSQVPFYVGLSISALLLYLKSSLSPGAEAHNLEEAPYLPHLSPNTPVDENFVLGEGNSFDICKIEAPDSEHIPHKKVHYSAIYPVDDYRFSGQSETYNNDSADLNIAFKSEQPIYNQLAGVGFGAVSVNDNGLGKTTPAVTTEPSVKVPPVVKPGEEPTPEDPTPEKKRNHAPRVSGPVYLSDQFQCTVLMIAIADLLSHATDADAGDVLSVGSVKVNGVLLEQSNGQYVYHGEELGPVTITYIVTDGQLSVATSAKVNFIQRDAINGTDGDDILLGTNCEDTINGQAGNDRIEGRNGDDVIHGGLGNDMLVGGEGNDVIYGEDGNDRIFGGAGNDILFGGAGNDIIFGEDGNDVIDGGTGDDVIDDGDGVDHVNGDDGNDTIVAAIDNAQDFFDGGSGNCDKLSYSHATNSVEFNAAKGTVTTSPGVTDLYANIEILEGGSADDVFRAALRESVAAPEETGSSPVTDEHTETEHTETDRQTTEHQVTGDQDSVTEASTSVADEAHDEHQVESHCDASEGFTYIGGEGSDTLDYSLAKQSILVDIVHGTASGAEIGTDHFDSIEIFVGGHGDDVFTVGQTSVSLNGGAGNDMFEFVLSENPISEEAAVQHISGFEVGDWVRIGQYDIFESNDVSGENGFQDIIDRIQNQQATGGDNAVDSVIPIHIRHELTDGINKTVIESGQSADGNYEFAIVIDGEHHLHIFEHQHV
jgi:Ca2+-binding RTX toxin-like protein